MADRGTAYSATADQYEFDVFSHVQEPWAAFPEADWDAVATEDQGFETDVSTWARYDLTDDYPIDWGDQFDVPHGGDGFFMQEPNTTDKKLQAAPNGHSSVTGALSIEIPLAGNAAGSAMVLATPKVDIALTAASAGTATLSAPPLTNLVRLEGASAGAAMASWRLNLLGTYRATVLADDPIFLAHLNEASGTTFYNATELGGAALGTYSGSYVLNQPSLVESETVGSLRALSNFTDARAAVANTAPTLTDDFSVEFWVKSTRSGAQMFTANLASDSFWGFMYADTRSSGAFTGAVRWQILGDRVDGFKPINDNQPHHVVATFKMDGSGVTGPRTGTLTIYVDGLRDASISTTYQVPESGWGAWAADGPVLYGLSPTYLDEWAMYDQALTPTQVARHYADAWFEPHLLGSVAGAATVAAGGFGSLAYLSALAAGQASVGSSLDVTGEGEVVLAALVAGLGSVVNADLHIDRAIPVSRVRARPVRRAFS